MGKSSSEASVALFWEARCVTVVNGCSSRSEESA